MRSEVGQPLCLSGRDGDVDQFGAAVGKGLWCRDQRRLDDQLRAARLVTADLHELDGRSRRHRLVRHATGTELQAKLRAALRQLGASDGFPAQQGTGRKVIEGLLTHERRELATVDGVDAGRRTDRHDGEVARTDRRPAGNRPRDHDDLVGVGCLLVGHRAAETAQTGEQNPCGDESGTPTGAQVAGGDRCGRLAFGCRRRGRGTAFDQGHGHESDRLKHRAEGSSQHLWITHP